MPSEVAPRTNASLAVPEQAGPILRQVLGADEVAPVDPEAVGVRITRQMLEAENADDLLKAGQAWSLDGLLGVPLEAQSVVVQESTLSEDDGGRYMLVSATRLDTGDEVVISTSAGNVMTRLAIAADRGWLPFKFKARKTDKPTSKGFYPYIVESV